MMRRGLGRTMARTAVIAGTATAVSNGVSRRQQNRYQTQADAQAYQEQQQAPPPQAYQQAPPPQAYAPPPAAPAEDDDITQIKQLADLHAQGILTDEEFAQGKARILGT
jgi:hemolysin activation/secretion protein